MLEMNFQCKKNMKGDHRAGVSDVQYQLQHTDVLKQTNAESYTSYRQRNAYACKLFHECKLSAEVLLGHK